MKYPRWMVTLVYRTDNGLLVVPHDVEELEEIQDLVERGPDWNALEKIEITLHSPIFEGGTVEEMQRFNAMTQDEAAAYLRGR